MRSASGGGGDSDPVYRLQQYTLHDFRGSLDDAEPTVRDLVVAYPARPVFGCALAPLNAKLGRLTEAKRALDEAASGGFSTMPLDLEWLYGMSLLRRPVPS